MAAELVPALASGIALAVGSLVTYAATRRRSSGRIGTSEASVLWEQTQALLGRLTAERDRTAEQRDRLIEAQAGQITPALVAITESLRQISDRLARLEDRSDD